MKNLLKGIPKNAYALGAASFLNDVASEMVAPILPIFLTVTLGAGPAALGLVEGVAEATSSLLKIVSGYISDRTKKRKSLVLAGYSVAALARFFLFTATSWLNVLTLRFADRIGKGIRTAPRDAILADSADAKFRGKVFGFHRALDHAGAIVGPLLAFFIIREWGFSYRTIFAITLIPGFLSALSIALFVKERRADALPSEKKFSLMAPEIGFRNYLIVIFIFTLGNASDAFLILRAIDLKIEPVWIPVLWAGFSAIKFIVSTPGGSLSDRIGRRPVIIAGWLIYALIYLSFAFASSPLHIIIIFGGYGIYYGLTEGVERAYVADIVPAGRRGAAFGLYNASVGLASLPASLLFGLIWKAFGVETAFIWAVSLALIASAGLILFVKSPRRAN